MDKFSPNIEHKTTNNLKTQVEEIEKMAEGHIYPESVSADEIFKMSPGELKSRFPLRYEFYLKLLRSKRKTESYDVSNDEIENLKKWLGILNSIDKYDTDYKNEVSEDPRHPKQQEVFSELRNFLEQGNDSGYIKLPTGSGKTIIFKRFLEAVDVRSLIVVPNNVIVDQTNEKLKKSSLKGQVGVVNMNSKDFESMCTITTYSSLIINLKNGELNPDDYSFIILDEAHKALGVETSEAIKKFKESVKIGFTATPEYSSDKNVSQLLDHEIYRMEVDEAIRAGMLSNARTWVVKTGIDISSVAIKNGEYSVNELEEKLNIVIRNKAAVEHYKKYFADRQGVAYCISIAHAESVKKLFTENGIEAEVISGKNTKKEKENILERYKKGEIKVLCNADILIEGFDHDKAGVCLNLRPTMSAVIAEQRGGRVLRLDLENPEKIGYVVDFLDNDKLAMMRDRPMPILYREVLGAMAVPRAIANESDISNSKDTPTNKGNKEEDYDYTDLDIISTEEQYKEISHAKEEYLRAIEDKKQERKKRAEDLEKERHLLRKFSAINERFNYITNETEQTISDLYNEISPFFHFPDSNFRMAVYSIKKMYDELKMEYNKNRESFYIIRKAISDGSDNLSENINKAEILKINIESLYRDFLDLEDKWLLEKEAHTDEIASEDQLRERDRVREDKHKEKIRMGNSEETTGWVTKLEIKNRAKSLGVSVGFILGMINDLEEKHEDLVALRKHDRSNVRNSLYNSDNYERVYSPLFLDEIEHRIFQTNHQKEMVSRGTETRVKSWKSEKNLHSFVKDLDIKDEQVSAIIRAIEKSNPKWVALRESSPGNLEYVYSSEFFDEFETEVLSKVV